MEKSRGEKGGRKGKEGGDVEGEREKLKQTKNLHPQVKQDPRK